MGLGTYFRTQTLRPFSRLLLSRVRDTWSVRDTTRKDRLLRHQSIRRAPVHSTPIVMESLPPRLGGRLFVDGATSLDFYFDSNNRKGVVDGG